MKKCLKALVLLFIMFSACALRAETFVDPRNFCEQKLEVFGLGGVPWEESSSHDEERSRAWMDALHHAFEKILNMQLMEGRLVAHVMQTNPELKTRLGSLLLSSPKFFYQSDVSGLIRCRIDVPFTGKNSLRSALYLAALRPQPQEPLALMPGWAAGAKIDESAPVPPFKRIVIDVRAYNFVPSLFPRFFDSTGMLLFQETMISLKDRFSRPAIRFMQDISKAREGFKEEETLTVAAHVNVLSRCDITVENPDAAILARFAREMIANPHGERDIAIVFSTERAIKTGRLLRSEKGNDASDKPTPATGGTK